MTSKSLRYWRDAATVTLIARNAKNSSKIPQNANSLSSNNNTQAQVNPETQQQHRLSDYKVLMLERSSKSKFMPSAYVFPGGAIGQYDRSSSWCDIFKEGGFASENENYDRLSLPTIVQSDVAQRSPMFLDIQDNTMHPEIAFRINAIRETFEECGILLYRKWKSNDSKLDKSLLKNWRDNVYRNDKMFLDMCHTLQVVPDIWSLHEWSNWLTPTNMDKLHGGKRFDTAFYICTMEKSIDAVHDEQETVSSEWCTTNELLERHKRGEIWLAPPQIYEMLRLNNFLSFDDLSEHVKERSTKGCERWLPVRINCKDIIIATLPGDDFYPSTPDLTGNEPAPSLDITSQQAREYSNRHHRFEFHSPHDTRFLCNIPAKYGHVNPNVIH